MPSVKPFSVKACEGLGSYVYLLIDPRDGQVFYVGKGRGNRCTRRANRLRDRGRSLARPDPHRAKPGVVCSGSEVCGEVTIVKMLSNPAYAGARGGTISAASREAERHPTKSGYANAVGGLNCGAGLLRFAMAFFQSRTSPSRPRYTPA